MAKPRESEENLFTYGWRQQRAAEAPLAFRLRPRDLTELLGQSHLLGPGGVLREAIEGDRLSSFILQGPPGSGKTALAQVIARRSRAHFVALNAAEAGTAQVRETIRTARERLGADGRRTILFLDELHRFNRVQQDSLLEAVEDGSILLIGATTENPSFAINGALLSRVGLYRFEALGEEDLQRLIDRAASDPERGLGPGPWEIGAEFRHALIALSAGDARVLLNALEQAARSARPEADGRRILRTETMEASARRAYDRAGDLHYDHASAFIKSLRGSDPDATLYYLGRMLEAGEDPRFIARRLMIQAAEDVGLADPRALLVAVAAAQVLEMVGLPEARIPLAEAALYLALAPKSNSVVAALSALDADLQERGAGGVPSHLKSNVDCQDKSAPYLYPHDFPDHYVRQEYRPEGLRDRTYYRPSESGEEPGLHARKPGSQLDTGVPS